MLPELIDPQIRDTIFAGRIRHFLSIGSTNTGAMQAASAGIPEGTVFLAEEQTSGRGRGGHSWDSDRGVGIYCSVVLRPAMEPAEVLVISLMAGLAVVNAVEQVTGLRADLRWPNDVLIGENKFCGILTELAAESSTVKHVVVGVGINVNQQSFAEELRQIATSLRIASGRPWSRVDLVAALLKSLHHEYREFLRDPGFARAEILRRFTEHSSFVRGAQVRVEEDGGYVGVTDGLDSRGFLKVQTDSGTRTVLHGGVRKLNGKS